MIAAVNDPPSAVVASVFGIESEIAEFGRRKIRVNGVSAGVVATDGYDAAGFRGSDFEKHGVAMTPLGRVGQPDDIALPVAYLASEDARWITGEIVYASVVRRSERSSCAACWKSGRARPV
jgi:3-oxoacyl-[acyl-carrier protein] reductase